MGPGGERVIPVSDFFEGPLTTTLDHGEILTEIRVPTPPQGSGGAYLKLERKVGDYATAGVAAVITVADGVCQQAGIGLTNAGPTPVKAGTAESFLVGKSLDDETIREAARLASQEAQPFGRPAGLRRVQARHGESDCRSSASPGLRTSRLVAWAASPAPGRLNMTTEAGQATAVQINVTVNGEEHSEEVEPRLLLVHFIREMLSLTGTHIGCDTTHCGACTILLDGKARQVVYCLCRPGQRQRGDDRGGPGAGRSSPSHPGSLYRRTRSPMRLLHSRNDDDRSRVP